MINLVDFKETFNATSAKCSSTGGIHEFRYFLAGILHLLYGKEGKGKEGNPTKAGAFPIAFITYGEYWKVNN